MNWRKIPASTKPDTSEINRARLFAENHCREMYVIRTENTTSRIWIAAERVKLKRARFSRISLRNGVYRAVGCSSASAASRLSPTSLSWPNAISTVARKVRAKSRNRLMANSISIEGRVNGKP